MLASQAYGNVTDNFSVIADDDSASHGMVAYLGGLDLTNGRYDDQNHFLYKSCENKHVDDFYQVNKAKDENY